MRLADTSPGQGAVLTSAGSLLVGFAAGLFLPLGEQQLAALLLVMAGFFLYLGATDLIPSLTTSTCRKRDVFATACGMVAIAAIAVFAH